MEMDCQANEDLDSKVSSTPANAEEPRLILCVNFQSLKIVPTEELQCIYVYIMIYTCMYNISYREAMLR